MVPILTSTQLAGEYNQRGVQIHRTRPGRWWCCAVTYVCSLSSGRPATSWRTSRRGKLEESNTDITENEAGFVDKTDDQKKSIPVSIVDVYENFDFN